MLLVLRRPDSVITPLTLAGLERTMGQRDASPHHAHSSPVHPPSLPPSQCFSPGPHSRERQ
ncbi:hypothetical protein E2C01_010886 [Portunus trituberculatus]|uniref:Uncharacterized protein n=1 Tax=Portunus trituberculatus TaxID=210409 RepID=A0A5B7DA18_PORTR|nr:hypothetical protein [Portunus trituberculatus]